MHTIKKFYTYAEAQAVVQALGIKSQPKYQKRRREDLRLPSAPYEFYADTGWVDWYKFLGTARPNLFQTYVEAQAAVQALDIKSRAEYRRCRCEHPRLPFAPNAAYADAGWMGWCAFLGTERSSLYSTYVEALSAVQVLGIKSQSDYQKRRSEDPRLPFSPDVTYKNAGWTDWYFF